MDLCFVIPAFNEEQLIGGTIDSIRSECRRAGVEAPVIVVDNASTDSTAAMARAHGAEVVRKDRKGTGYAREAGLQASAHELIAFIDADSQLPTGWLDTVKRVLANPAIVAVSGPCVFPSLGGFTRFLIDMYYRIAGLTNECNRIFFRRASVLQGGNCVIRKDALLKIGGFNTNLSFYGDDTDTAKRLSRVGRVYFTTSLPIHSSARRIKAEGVAGAALRYVINHFWILLFGKAFHAQHTDIRRDEKM